MSEVIRFDRVQPVLAHIFDITVRALEQHNARPPESAR